MAVTHRSLSISVESSFGSLDPTTGLPSQSGLSFTSIPCERDPIVIAGEPVVSERNDARDGSYFVPAEPDTVWASGSRVRRRTGSIVCRVDLTTIGTAADNYTTNYLGLLLGAGLKTKVPSVISDTVTSVDENIYTPTSAPAITDIGTLISTSIAGRAEYSAITDNDNGSGNVVLSPALSDDGYTSIRGLQTWYTPSRTDTGDFESSVAFRIEGVNFLTLAYGCVLESMNITLDNGRLMAELTYQAAYITDDHASATGPIEPSYNTGAAPLFRGAYAVVSDASPTSLTNATSADSLGRIALDCEDFSLTYTNTLTPLGHSNSILAMSGMEISDVVVELSMTVSTVNTTIKDDFFNRTVRQVLIGTGPQGDGQGCAIMIPAAMLTNDPNVYDISGNDIVRQQLTYQQSRYAGDFGTSAYEANAGNSPFRIALGV